ncbi:MAG: ferredoxin family protein [Nitrososphaerales archaeon]|jgi:NAD-dependent dihydropyrimidine dehydrogenase PreA subunit
MTRDPGYKSAPIDPNFLSKPDQFPITGEHNGHKVRAAGISRMDGEGKPLPTKHGIHGTAVAVDWESCVADGVCMDVCPVFVFEWILNPGQAGTGKDKVLEKGTPEWNEYRTDKCEPIRETDCIFCMACETSCPTQSIKITQP